MLQFWETADLESLSAEQWESLCDRCGKCCLHKLEDEDTQELVFTRVVCRYFDEANCTCSDYTNRHRNVPSCVVVTPDLARHANWLPDSCAYRLVAQQKPLPAWHHLISGSYKTIADQQQDVRGAVISEEYVHPDGYDEHIIQWVNAG